MRSKGYDSWCIMIVNANLHVHLEARDGVQHIYVINLINIIF